MAIWKGLLAASLSLAMAMTPVAALASDTSPSGGLGVKNVEESDGVDPFTGALGDAYVWTKSAPAAASGIATAGVSKTAVLDDYLAPAWDDDTLAPLYPFAGTEYNITASYDMPYLIGVDTTNQVITVVKRGESGNYDVPVKYFLCSTGKASTPTPAGIHFLSVSNRPEWVYFKTPKCWVRYPVNIYGNYFFHSLVYNSQSLSSRTSASYNNLGTAVSNGCIRMMDDDAMWMSYNVFAGTIVEVYAGLPDPTLNQTLKARQP